MSMIPGYYLLQFFQRDREELCEKLSRVEEAGEAIVNLVNFGAAPKKGDLIPVPVENPVDVFSEIGESIFASLVTKLAMYSISASARALELEEAAVAQVNVQRPEALAQPLPPQATPSPQLAEKLQEQQQPWYKRLAAGFSSLLHREGEEFRLYVETAKRSLLEEYYGSKDLIRHQGEARRLRELSNLRLKVSETVPELVKQTHEFVANRLRQIEEYLTAATRGGP